MNEICYVKIILDDDPEYMTGMFRCGSVISEDKDGVETEHHDLIDNTEFSSELKMKQSIAKMLKVDVNIVEIID